MSAWVVSKTHIDLLVRASLHYGGDSGHGLGWWQVNTAGGWAGWRYVDEFAERRADTEVMSYWTPSMVGQMLVSENVRSVAHRYSEPGRTPYYGAERAAGMDDLDPDMGELPGPTDAYYIGPYVYDNPGYTLKPGELFKAIDCYDYQSCEHDEWMASEAYAFCRSLRESACRSVDGYANSPWGWEDDDLKDKPREFSRRIM